MEILKVEKIVFGYGGLQVLQNISFSVQKGEKVALIGPNGAGKTTVLNVLTGLLAPQSGKISLLGQDITHRPTHTRASLGLARSFQVSSLFPELSVLSNVLLALHGIQKTSRQMIRSMTAYKAYVERADELLESVDLLSKREVVSRFLSHGEQRRLELILSLASSPKVLLLDEPTAGLTTEESSVLAQMLLNPAHENGGDLAVLFVAHDLDLVFTVAERILVLYYGIIIAEGTAEEIQENQSVREIYLGEATSA
jgi:branched-chain amino acid transport system ATP-binding protein